MGKEYTKLYKSAATTKPKLYDKWFGTNISSALLKKFRLKKRDDLDTYEGYSAQLA